MVRCFNGQADKEQYRYKFPFWVCAYFFFFSQWEKEEKEMIQLFHHADKGVNGVFTFRCYN